MPPVNRACQIGILCFSALLLSPGARAQVSFYTTIDLALRNNPQVRMSSANLQRAQAGVREAFAVFKPSLLLGSSVGFSYGFPLGQPEIFSLTAQSLAFSFSQPDYVRSARAAYQSAQLQLEDVRQQTILDTALDYIELSKVTQEITALDQEETYVQKLIGIEDQRVDAGVDGRIELTKARLTAAQVTLKRIHAENQADLLRARLAHLTGLAPGDMKPESQSIPGLPEMSTGADIDEAAVDANNGVKAAFATAKSKLYTAFGDSRSNNRPTLSFVASYGLFSNFNNYAEYYRKFQNNNFGAGIEIEIPLFDANRTAKAESSKADAAYASAEAQQLRGQTGEQILQLQKSISELAAQEQVAELENELAVDQLNAVAAQLESGSGNPNQPSMTPKDQQEAHIDERSRYIDMLDAKFQVTQARLNLLRELNRIEDWVKMPAQPNQ